MIVATGVSYRRLEADGLDALTGRGVYYGADASDARQVVGDDVYIVGAANSAGQAALNMARHAQARRDGRPRRAGWRRRCRATSSTASRRTPPSRCGSAREVAAARGDGHLESLTLARPRRRARSEEVPASWLFVFIGAAPRTDWLGEDVVARRARVRRDRAGPAGRVGRATWPLPRAPYALETSVPGVFAAGDVRLDSMKRVASAVGEGAMAVHLVHRYLATDADARRGPPAAGPASTGSTTSGSASCCPSASEIEIEPGAELFHEGEPADTGGCSSTARSTWSGRSAARRPWSRRMDVPGPVGGRLPRLGRDRRLPRHGPRRRARAAAAGAGRGAARRAAGRGSRSAVHLIGGVFAHGRPHRVDGPAARVAGHPRHARRRPRPRAQQPGRRGDAVGGRPRRALHRRCWPRSASWPTATSRADAVPRPSTSSAARSRRGRRRRDPIAARRRRGGAGRLAGTTTASTTPGRWPRRWPPPAWTWPGASARPSCWPGRRSSRGSSGWPAPSRPGRCSRRCGRRRAGSPSWWRGALLHAARPGRPAAGRRRPRASRARW